VESVIDDNEITRWCFSNTVIKVDYNNNSKPIKLQKENKIDGVISILTALGGLLTLP
jgi:phage terminase large subunit-like protein